MKSLDGVNKKNDVNNTASEAPEKNVKTESEKIDFSKVKVEPLFEEFVNVKIDSAIRNVFFIIITTFLLFINIPYYKQILYRNICNVNISRLSGSLFRKLGSKYWKWHILNKKTSLPIFL